MPPTKDDWYEASSTYRAIFDEGFEQGVKLGRARLELVTLGADKFGVPTAPVSAALQRIRNPDALQELILAVDRTSSWQDLFASMADRIPGLVSRPRVLLLGTGGAINERRQQACLLVERANPALPPILLDTGSGMEVVRAMLAAGVDPVRVSDIFVSHRHGDHAGGLDPLLLWRRIQHIKAGRAQREAGARVYAEPRVIEAIKQQFEAGASTTIEVLGPALEWKPLVDGQPVPLPGGGSLIPFLVDHAPVDGGAMGCVLEIDGVKIAYSGDTRPCDRLIEAVRGADLLFHEVGGLDHEAEWVHKIAHSTAGDAGRAAKVAGVKRFYLTHLPDDSLVEAMQAEAHAAFGGPVELAVDQGIVQV